MTTYDLLGIRIPQPGERWRIRIRPVEWKCPGCGELLHVSAAQRDGRVAAIVNYTGSISHHRECGAQYPFPAGWVVYRLEGIPSLLCLPYTMFEPIEEGE